MQKLPRMLRGSAHSDTLVNFECYIHNVDKLLFSVLCTQNAV